jgi:hypothetical protein
VRCSRSGGLPAAKRIAFANYAQKDPTSWTTTPSWPSPNITSPFPSQCATTFRQSRLRSTRAKSLEPRVSENGKFKRHCCPSSRSSTVVHSSIDHDSTLCHYFVFHQSSTLDDARWTVWCVACTCDPDDPLRWPHFAPILPHSSCNTPRSPWPISSPLTLFSNDIESRCFSKR